MKTTNTSSISLVLLLLLLQQIQLVSGATCETNSLCYWIVIFSSLFGTPLICCPCLACICIGINYTYKQFYKGAKESAESERKRNFALQRRLNANQAVVATNQTTSSEPSAVIKQADVETGIVDPKPIPDNYFESRVETFTVPPTYDAAVSDQSTSDAGTVSQDTIPQSEGQAD